MGFDVLYDPAKEVGAMIDPEAGRALGPVLSGPADVVQPLFDSFIGGINADPAKLHPSDLDRLFRGFLEAVAEEESPAAEAGESPAAEAAEVPAGVAETSNGDGAPTGTDPVQPAQAPAAEQAQPGEQGGKAGPAQATEQSVPTGGAAPGATTGGGIVADGGQSTGIEQAREPDPAAPGAAGVEPPAAGGIPKAPGA